MDPSHQRWALSQSFICRFSRPNRTFWPVKDIGFLENRCAIIVKRDVPFRRDPQPSRHDRVGAIQERSQPRFQPANLGR
jgi:hypothetical protein